jgi:hypothetical protein
MSGIFSAAQLGLIMPALALALTGWLVPKLLATVFPEGVRPLLLMTFFAILIMLALGMLFFLGLYLWQGISLANLTDAGTVPFMFHFLRLGAISALLWAPIMILSVAGLPKTWVKETW